MSRNAALALVLIGSLSQACAHPDEAPPSAPRPLDPAASAPAGPPGFVMLDINGPAEQQYEVSQPRPASRPRLSETKVIGRSELPSSPDASWGQQSWGEEDVYDCGASCSQAPAPAPGYVTYSQYGGGHGHDARPSGRSSEGSAARGTPPVGGNWPAVPSYGPAAMGDRGKR